MIEIWVLLVAFVVALVLGAAGALLVLGLWLNRFLEARNDAAAVSAAASQSDELVVPFSLGAPVVGGALHTNGPLRHFELNRRDPDASRAPPARLRHCATCAGIRDAAKKFFRK